LIGILIITRRIKGKLLAFGERGTYNPATGNERANRLGSHSVPEIYGGLAGEAPRHFDVVSAVQQRMQRDAAKRFGSSTIFRK
jgi:hypothetical protein